MADPSRKIRKGKQTPCRAGSNFTPHSFTVNAGEDINMKITSLSRQGPQAICIISANGILSGVTLRRPDSPGGTVTYEGRFEILALRGSLVPNGSGEMQSKCGGMTIAFMGPDGFVVGGAIAGPMVAAGLVEVTVASFLIGDKEISTATPISTVPASSANPLPI